MRIILENSNDKVVGYAYCPNELDYEKAHQLLLNNGCDKIFFEKAPATTIEDLTELKKILPTIHKGDVVFVFGITRLSPSVYYEISEILNKTCATIMLTTSLK